MSNDHRYYAHERLMTRLADANGVDLDLLMQSGSLSPERYEDAVLNCTGCSNPEGCDAHLRAGRSEIPDFCRNGEWMKGLSEAAPSSD